MPERTPTAGRYRRTIRRLTAFTVLVALVCTTGYGAGSTASTGGIPPGPSATSGGKGQQKAPVNKRTPK